MPLRLVTPGVGFSRFFHVLTQILGQKIWFDSYCQGGNQASVALNIKKCIGRQSQPRICYPWGVKLELTNTFLFPRPTKSTKKQIPWLATPSHSWEGVSWVLPLFRSIFRKYLGLKTGWFFTPIFCAVGRAENLQQNTKKLLRWSWDASPYTHTHTPHTHIYLIYLYSTYIYIHIHIYTYKKIIIYIYIHMYAHIHMTCTSLIFGTEVLWMS